MSGYYAQYNNFSYFEEYLLSVRHNVIKRIKGETINNYGEFFNYNYYILNGKVRSTMISDTGHLRFVPTGYKKGAIFPLYYPSPVPFEQTVAFIAGADCTILAYENVVMEECVNSNPDFNRAMYGCYVNMVNEMSEEINNHIYRTGIQNMCDFFLKTLEENPEWDDTLCFTQDELAFYIGLNRSNVARCLKQLREEEILETHRNKIIVKNIKKMKKLTDKSD